MRIFILALFIALVSNNIEAFYESNRMLHLGVSLALTIIAYNIKPRFVLTFIVVFFLGLYKEMLDPVIDYIDMIANCVGIGLGYIICKQLR